jgi:mannose-1-phosphate guanylyltransferase
MAGGGGTRLWPASRKRRPKQFLPLLAVDGDEPRDESARTLLGATVARVQGLVPPERILVVTAADQVDEVARTAPSVPRDNIVIEPEARNTAACIGLGALEVLRRDPAGVLAVLPSDQWVRDAEGYRATLERAIDVARAGAIVTIGIVPTHPETGFGYLELGHETERGVRVVERFVEKPDLE